MAATEQNPREESVRRPKSIEGDQSPTDNVEHPSNENAPVEEENRHFHTAGSEDPETRDCAGHLSCCIRRSWQ